MTYEGKLSAVPPDPSQTVDEIPSADKMYDITMNSTGLKNRVQIINTQIINAAHRGQSFIHIENDVELDSTVAPLFRKQGYTFAFPRHRGSMTPGEVRISWAKSK